MANEESGTIVGIQALGGLCIKCGERADYRVERTNTELLDEPSFIRAGTRAIYYCEEHLPDHERLLLDSLKANATLPPGL